MKRIIELPDDVVKAIQNGEDYRYDIHTAIAQSTPYNPSGDCISREALKEAIRLYDKNVAEETWLQLYDSVLETIDNADAVDLWQMRQEATENALKKAEVLYGRPQGEWISREALKEQINATDFDFGDYYDNTEEIRKCVCETIDSAQAISLPNEQIAWEQGYEAGLAQGKHDKPQGEWKTVDGYDGDEYYECSNCGEPWFLSAGTPKDNNMNFCPNCGAEMKGGAE